MIFNGRFVNRSYNVIKNEKRGKRIFVLSLSLFALFVNSCCHFSDMWDK